MTNVRMVAPVASTVTLMSDRAIPPAASWLSGPEPNSAWYAVNFTCPGTHCTGVLCEARFVDRLVFSAQ